MLHAIQLFAAVAAPISPAKVEWRDNPVYVYIFLSMIVGLFAWAFYMLWDHMRTMKERESRK